MDPSVKGNLYDALEKDGLTLKDWVLTQAQRYLDEREQLMLFEEQRTKYNAKATNEGDRQE